MNSMLHARCLEFPSEFTSEIAHKACEIVLQGQDQQQAAALPKAAQMHAVVAAASSGAPAYSTDTNLELAVLASEAAVDFTAAVNPADSSTELAAYNLPPPPSSNQLGSLDLCISMLQHYITPDTTWPPAALQHFRDFASALPNTLFLVVECGQWLDCVGSDFAGKPAITVMRVSPVKVEGDYELYIMAYKVNQDGWPTDEAFASPSAFEALTTRVGASASAALCALRWQQLQGLVCCFLTGWASI